MATPTALPSTFTANTVLPAASLNLLRGAFRVLQVVQGLTTTGVSNSTITAADTTLTATITPQYNTSQVLVLVSQTGCEKTATNSQNGINLYLLRGATQLQQFAYAGLYTNSTVQGIGYFGTVFLDSPATTAATTYKTTFANFTAAALVSVQVANITQSTITLVEISA